MYLLVEVDGGGPEMKRARVRFPEPFGGSRLTTFCGFTSAERPP